MKTIPESLKRSVKIPQVIAHFKKSGIELSKSDAEKYLDLLYFFADKVVHQNLLPGNGTYFSKPQNIEPQFKANKIK